MKSDPPLLAGRRMMLIFPPVFDWEDGKMPDSFKPRCHIFYGTRTFDIEDGVPKFEGMKEKSDTLPECEGDSDFEDDANGKADQPPQANGKPDKHKDEQHSSQKARASAGDAAPDDSIASHVKRQRTSAGQQE